MGTSLTGVRHYRNEITLFTPSLEWEQQQRSFSESFRALLGSARTLLNAKLETDAADVYRAALTLGMRRLYMDKFGKTKCTKKAPALMSALRSAGIMDREDFKLLSSLFNTGNPVDFPVVDTLCLMLIYTLCNSETEQDSQEAWEQLLGEEVEA